MQIALNGATTMWADLETDIRAASEAGFNWLEIWASKLRTFLESHSIADLNTLFAGQNLKPYSINSIERITFRSADEHRSLLAECDDLAIAHRDIRCDKPARRPHLAIFNQQIDLSHELQLSLRLS